MKDATSMNSPPPAAPTAPPGAWPMVGRDGMLARVRSALDTDGLALVVLSGEAGVGKTRLATEAAELLERAGWRSSRVMASASLSDVPLAALIPLMGATRHDLSRIGTDTATLMAFARDLAAERRQEGPLLVVVDDAPQLDTLSIAVLAQLAAAGAVSLLATVRDGEPLPEPLVALWTSDRALRIALEPLSIDDLDTLLAAVLGGSVVRQTTMALHGASGGNPLFVRELVANALSTGALSEQHGTWVLTGAPGGSRALDELIAGRLAELDEAAREVMERLAVCQTIPVGHIVEPALRAALDRLEQAQLVQVRPEGHRFVAAIAHPQYAAAMRQAVPTLRRIDLLLDHVDRAEGAADREADAVRIATWRLDAGAPGDAGLLTDAARLALLADDFELVARLAEAAERSGGSDPELLLLHADALIKLGRVNEALRILERARAADDAAPTDEHRSARILTMTATAMITVSGRFEEALQLLDGAPERLPLAARRLRQARARILVGLERPREALDELSLIDSGGTPGEQAELAVNSVVPNLALGRTDEALRAVENVQASGYQDEASVPARVVALMRAVVLAQACRLEEARAAASDALADAIVLDDALRARQAEFTLSALHLSTGRLETAARWAKDAITGARSLGPAGYEPLGRALLARVRAQQGQQREAREVLGCIPERLIDDDSLVLLAWAWVEAGEGRAAAARERLAERTRQCIVSGDLDFGSVLAFDLARLGDAPTAAALLDEMAAAAPAPVIALRAQGARAMAADDLDLLVAAGDDWEQRGYLLHAAESLALAADAAKRAGRGREATHLAGRARGLAERTEGATTALLAVGDQAEPLTPREREIATLAARGMASNDIAARLFLSPRTVSNHLQSAYTKLGVRRRSELAAALGLIATA